MDSRLQMTIMVTAALVLGVALILGLGISAAVGGTHGDPSKEAVEPAGGTGQTVQRDPSETVAFAISVAVTTSMACVSAAYAVGKVGAAALGAASERPEILGRSLLFVGLAEGIAIYGLIIAILLLGYLK